MIGLLHVNDYGWGILFNVHPEPAWLGNIRFGDRGIFHIAGTKGSAKQPGKGGWSYFSSP